MKKVWPKTTRWFAIAIFLVLCPAGAGLAEAQNMDGELRVRVRDPEGLAVPARVILEGRNPRFEAMSEAGTEGEARLGRIPHGIYSLTVLREGFEPAVRTVEVRSALPQELIVILEVAGSETLIVVRESAPLLDTGQPSAIMQVGRRQLDEVAGTTLGRSAVEVVTTLPGWLLEANAVLHPRGSEYDTQYVVDGMPLYDNRSIGFAPAFESGDFESVNVMTAGLPAEFGRRLGGVIALDTRRVNLLGSHTELDLQRGSYGTVSGSVRHQFSTARTAITFGGNGGMTDRYLDPPALENFTNTATSGGAHVRIDQSLGDQDRLSFALRTSETRFLVPNDLIQQESGQRQDRFSAETSAQTHYQHVFSPRMLGAFRVMYRDLSAALWSNPVSTPVRVEQDRGLEELVFVADLTIQGEGHALKFGGDLRMNDVREAFRFGDTDTFPAFDVDFEKSGDSREGALYIQDQLRWGRFAANLGVRYDRYDFLIDDDAISPRIGLSYWFEPLDLMLRASYDRVFQPPPIENLLLSSSAEDLDDVGGVEESVPLPASRAHFFEVGLRKPFLDVFRLDISHYWRRFRNMIDDDVFLNTGLSFPISFDTARVAGTEVRIDMPAWRRFSSSVSYSNMIGHATSPVTGGLFVEGGEAGELRDVVTRFAISQDQRNTLSALARVQLRDDLWLSSGVRYGSGLPVEIEDDDDDGGGADDDQEIPQAILDRVDFQRGRVRPNFSLDLSVGYRFWEDQERSVAIQADVRNVTDRLDVINFSGVFSGTALAPGRQFTIRTSLEF